MKSRKLREKAETGDTQTPRVKWLSTSPRFIQSRVIFGAYLLCIAVCTIYVANNINARVMPRNAESVYYFGPTFPPGVIAGHDFWTTFTYASMLTRGNNIKNLPSDIPEKMRGYFTGDRNVSTYPPLIFMLYAPYLLLSYDQAYWLHMVILFLLNIGVIGLAAKMFRRAIPLESASTELFGLVEYSVMACVCVVTVTGYGYLFSVERGNCDILSLAFALGALWFLLEKPKHIWVPVLLFSCAVHTKITPAVLVVLLFWRHGWRCVLPLLVCNVGLLFVWGIDNALIFLDGLKRFSAAPDGWWGDHSAYSFAFTVLKPAGLQWGLWEKLIIAFSAIQWGVACVVLKRRGLTGMNMLLAFAVSIPLMLLAPSTSNDYKLVILYAPMAIFLLGWFWGYAYLGHRGCLALLLLQVVILYYLSGSGGLCRTPWLMNKLPLVLITQTLMFITILYPQGVFRSYAGSSGSIKSAE